MRFVVRPESYTGSPDVAYVDYDRGWVVQVWEDNRGCDGTPWAGTLRVSVKHSLATTLEDFQSRESSGTITWDDLQAVKDHWWPDQIAIEIYPPHQNIVNAHDMRWLWVLPRGVALPLNLEAGSRERLQG